MKGFIIGPYCCSKVAVRVALPVPMVKVVVAAEVLLTLAPVPVTVQPLKTYPEAWVAVMLRTVPAPTNAPV